MIVSLYIQGQKVDLFTDEKIDIKLSAKDVRDITKNVNDYSKSFSIPASENVNKIFSYWYENSLVTGEESDFRNRVDALIEIDLVTFREGEIMLESVELKDDEPYSYEVTFYGKTRTLKDLMIERKLFDLDYSHLEFEYTFSNVRGRVQVDEDVNFPLLSSRQDRYWQFGDGGANDVTTNVGAINYTELFPAIKVSKIIELIESSFGVFFEGAFLQTQRFKKLYLLYKKTETLENFETKNVIIKAQLQTSPANNFFRFQFIPSDNYAEINGLNPQTVADSQGYNGNYNQIAGTQIITANIEYLSSPKAIFIDMYELSEDGSINLFSSVTCSSNGSYELAFFDEEELDENTNTKYVFKIRSNTAVSFKINLVWTAEGQVRRVVGTWRSYSIIRTGLCNNITFDTININLSAQAPDMLIIDFLRELFKVFNLVIIPKGGNTYYLEPLQEWYDRGRIIDITGDVDVTTQKRSRIPLYEEINFQYEQSKSLTNYSYRSTEPREYADQKETYPYDGGKYEVKPKFEMPLFTVIGNGLEVGFLIDEQGKSYQNKPILLYNRGSQPLTSGNFKMTDGGSVFSELTSFLGFGVEMAESGVRYSLAWGNENSVKDGVLLSNSLISTYYGRYLTNLFDKRNRLESVKGYFSVDKIVSLRLNDRLVIGEKRYIINDINLELTTGNFTIELMHDFFTLRNATFLSLSSSEVSVEIPINMINGATEINITGDLVATPDTLTADGVISLAIPSFVAEDIERYTTDDDQRLTTDGDIRILTHQTTSTTYINTITWTLEDGTIETQDIIIQQND